MYFIEKIKEFLGRKSPKQKIIVIYGPTASGKTGLSIEVAKYLSSEIISTDSRQIFKYLDIGTGKVTLSEMYGVKHHMIDIITPDIDYSVGEYKVEVEKIITDIVKKGQIPILCGGTGLYIDSLIYDFDIPKIPADHNLREDLEKQRLEFGNLFIWEKLNEIDPDYAKEIHPNNYRYVIRAIEVKIISGKSKMEFRTNKTLKYDVLFLTPYNGNRKELYEKIDLRIKQMFDFGLIDEVKNLLKIYTKDDFGLKTIGYKEVIDYLEGNISLQECLELVQKNNRNYAKRQLTWFRKYEEDLEI